MRIHWNSLAALRVWVLNKTTFSKASIAKAKASAEVSTFHGGQRVRLTSILYGTSEEGTLISETPIREATYGTHTIRKDDGNKYRTQGTLEHPTSPDTEEAQA